MTDKEIIEVYKDYLLSGSNAYIEKMANVELVRLPNPSIKGSCACRIESFKEVKK